MRFYLDHNMPYTCVKLLKKRKHNVVHTTDLGYESRDDHFHHQEAKRQERVLITNDSHFLNETRFPLNKHPGIVVVQTTDVLEGLTLFLDGLKSILRRLNRELTPNDKLTAKNFLYETRVTIGSQDSEFPVWITHLRYGTAALTEEEILYVPPSLEDVFTWALDRDQR